MKSRGNYSDVGYHINYAASTKALSAVTAQTCGVRGQTVAADAAAAGGTDAEVLEVWIDQQLCTGDGLCVQYAPEVFEFDVDGLAYVKDAGGELKQDEGARVGVPANLRLDVLDSAKECPGNCIHVARVADGVLVAGPDA
jgi:ferredoxin